MTLLELRRYAVRNGVRIHFAVDAAGECLVNEHGVLKIPSLRATPDFNLEASLDSVEYFTLAPAGPSSKSQKLSRDRLQALLSDAPPTEHAHEE